MALRITPPSHLSKNLNKKRVVPGAVRGDPWHAYHLLKHSVLGTGTFSVVRSVSRKSDSRVFACKEIDKTSVDAADLSQIATEVRVLRKITRDSNQDHRVLVALHEVYESDSHVHLIMEHCGGGELFAAIRRLPHFGEPDAALVMAQLLSGIRYLHSRRIVHRDIKPENIVLSSRTSLAIRIVDLGLAKILHGDGTRTPCGTPAFLAPEAVVAHQSGPSDEAGELASPPSYDHRVDVWAAGCVLYTLLSGSAPFNPSNGDVDAMLDAIKAGALSFPSPVWESVSHDARDLVSGLLRVDPSSRLSAEQALAHPWFPTMGIDVAAIELGSYFDDALLASSGSATSRLALSHSVQSHVDTAIALESATFSSSTDLASPSAPSAPSAPAPSTAPIPTPTPSSATTPSPTPPHGVSPNSLTTALRHLSLRPARPPPSRSRLHLPSDDESSSS